jgi:hypothetical protein
MADNERREDTPEAPADAGPREEDLGAYWAVMRRMRGAEDPRPLTPEEEAARVHPGDLVIGTSRNRTLVTIHPDGTIGYGEAYSPDEAARVLWESIARRRPDFEARLRYMDLLELHIALIAVTDAAYEAATIAARAPGAGVLEEQRVELSRRDLEVRVHGIIEFAREYATMRPDLIRQAHSVTSVRQNPPGDHGVR